MLEKQSVQAGQPPVTGLPPSTKAPLPPWYQLASACSAITPSARATWRGNELHRVLNLATLPVMALQHSQELISFCLQVNELKTKIYGLRQQQQKYLSKTHNVSSCQIYSTLFTMLMCDARLLLSGRSTRFIFPNLSQMMASFNCLFFPECIHPYLLNGVFSTMGRENKLNFNQRVSILITAGLLSLYSYQ